MASIGITKDFQLGKAGAMTLRCKEMVAESVLVGFSGGFLLCYIAAKIAVWPWGAYSY